MSRADVRTAAPGRRHTTPLVTRAAVWGGATGIAVGMTELVIGTSIRPWIGNKYDTVGLGSATVVLATVGLTCGIALRRAWSSLPAHRLLLALGLLVPGLIGFTTAGRLWTVPGAMLCTAALAVGWGLRTHAAEVATVVEARWADVLIFVLGLYLAALGAAAGRVVGVIGIGGGVAIMSLAVFRARVPHLTAVTSLAAAAAPFALATWWSIVTPLVALLVVLTAVAFRVPHDVAGPSEEVRV